MLGFAWKMLSFALKRLMLEIAWWSLKIFWLSKCSIIFRLENARIENSKLKVVLEIARLKKNQCSKCSKKCSLSFLQWMQWKIIPYSSWGLGVRMNLLGANNFECTSKPTEYSSPHNIDYLQVNVVISQFNTTEN